MNDSIIRGRSPRWLRRAGVLAAAALLVAGCGSPGGQAAGLSAYQKALPFAQCMRSHGVPDYPDPLSNGNFGEISNSIQHSPQYAGAKQTCTRLHPWNMALSQHQQALEMAQLLKYARCMRAHGVPNFSDPIETSNGISFGGPATAGSAGSGQGSSGSGQGSGKSGGGSGSPATGNGGGSGPPSESPQYQAANQACQSYLHGAQAARAGGQS